MIGAVSVWRRLPELITGPTSSASPGAVRAVPAWRLRL